MTDNEIIWTGLDGKQYLTAYYNTYELVTVYPVGTRIEDIDCSGVGACRWPTITFTHKAVYSNRNGQEYR